MNQPLKQHLIDPEICIRCYTCEAACPVSAITHDDNNVVVDAEKCNFCMDCISPCPTGSIDNWRVVMAPYSLDEQFSWDELPAQSALSSEAGATDTSIEALDENVAALLAEAHKGAGGKARAPASASKRSNVRISPPCWRRARRSTRRRRRSASTPRRCTASASSTGCRSPARCDCAAVC